MTLAMEYRFTDTVEQQMRSFFCTLSEKDRRRYAAIEAIKLPHGGLCYIAEVLGCCENTISSGMKEIPQLADGDPLPNRVRSEGGGRPKKEVNCPNLKDELQAVIEDNTAGSPTVPGLKWTHLTVTEIAAELFKRGIKVARGVISRLLGEMGFKSRQQVKSKTKAPSRDRDEQFDKIHEAVEDYENTGDPVFSVDSKRKESLGPIQRTGQVIANQAAEVLDHNLPAYNDGEVTPHGIYDVQENTGHVSVTTGSDTGEFAVESLRWYWQNVGSETWPRAKRILLLGDCGGSNSYRSHPFKHHLQNLANDLDLPIQVAHYPVHCSKYNPIERREFCHVERSFSGRIFETASDVAEAAASTTTKTGLTITTVELPEFEPVRRSGKTFPEPQHVQHDKDLPDYNYTLTPQKNLKL